MPTPITVTRYKLRASNPMPKAVGSECPTGLPTTYVLQTFGVEVSDIDSWDSLVGLYGSEVMQGRQNFEDSATFRASSYSKVTYNGTNNRNTDGVQIFKGQEEHTAEWMDEQASGLVWFS